MFVNDSNYKKSALSFAQRLTTLRRIQGKKQLDIAKAIGCSDKTLSKWETEETEPSMMDLKKLSQFFNISLDFLISGKPTTKDDAVINKQINDKYAISSFEEQINEILKPYGRFSAEEKSSIFNITEKEILVNIDALVSRGDIDLYHKLNRMYRFVKFTKLPTISKYENNISKQIFDKPYQLTLRDCLNTDRIIFYEEAYNVLQNRITAHIKNKESLKNLGYVDYNLMAGIAPNEEQELSDALSGVLAKWPDANDVLKFLLKKGAYIQVKVPWEHTEGYHIERDEAQTNLLKKMLNCK